MIQEEFIGLQKIITPIDRDNLSVEDYLSQITYPHFLKIIKEIRCIQNDYSNIEFLCNAILETLHNYNKNDKSYITFYNAMDKIHNNLYFSYIEETKNIHGIWEKYCRVRPCKSYENFSALEMLHLPFTLREQASSSRFSLPGTPCSYMSLQDCLAWIECNAPENFVLMKVGIKSTEKQKYRLLRLDFRPHEHFRIDGFGNLQQDQIERILKNLCYNLPIVLACSFICKDRKSDYKEEYIIPQLLMSWIKENNSHYIGIRYNTAIDNPKAFSYGGHNVAIPILSPGPDGYCKKLQEIFDLEHAEVNKYYIGNRDNLPYLIRSYLE